MTEVRTTNRVSEKSTKQELWFAYNKLLLEVEKDSIVSINTSKEETQASEAVRSLAEVKLKIGTELDKIASDLLQSINLVEEFKSNFPRQKKQIIEGLQSQKEALEEEINKVKKNWEQDKLNYQIELAESKRQKELAIKREDDEYRYALEIKRRNENDELLQKQKQREQILAEKEVALAKRQGEIDSMERSLSSVPAQTEQAIGEECKKLAKELSDRHAIEINDIRTAASYEKHLDELKITNLSEMIKNQATDLELLKRQLIDATKLLKDVAVSVIEGGQGQVSKNQIDSSEK